MLGCRTCHAIFNVDTATEAMTTMVSYINSMDAKSESGIKSLRNHFMTENAMRANTKNKLGTHFRQFQLR